MVGDRRRGLTRRKKGKAGKWEGGSGGEVCAGERGETYT